MIFLAGIAPGACAYDANGETVCGDSSYGSWFGFWVILGLIVLGLIIRTWEKDHKKKA